MFRVVSAHQFVRPMRHGKTRPCLMGCSEIRTPEQEANDDHEAEELEIVVKMEAGCERRKNALIAESLAAMLANDLELPVPEPFLVQIEREFAETIPDAGLKSLALDSLGWAFGSKKLPPQFAVVSPSATLPKSLIPTAAEILAFDVLICNSDRRVGKPNCLGDGNSLAIIDHELGFMTEGILGWRPPWQAGGVFFAPGEHRPLFLDAVRGKSIDFQRLKEAFAAIPSSRFDEYRSALPREWQGTNATIDATLAYLVEMARESSAALDQITHALR